MPSAWHIPQCSEPSPEPSPPPVPGQVGPCSPSWQEQTLGAMQMPRPQPKEQRAGRERSEGRGGALCPAQGGSARWEDAWGCLPNPGRKRLLGRMSGARGQALTKDAVPTAHGGRPAWAAATPEPREADVGAQLASAREESTVHVPMHLQRGERPPSQSLNKQLSGPTGEATRSFQREETRTARLEAAQTRSVLQTRAGEHRAAWPAERAAPGPQLRGGKRQWMESHWCGCLRAFL